MIRTKKNVFWLLVVSCVVAFSVLLAVDRDADSWPSVKQENSYKTVVKKQIERWQNKGLSLDYVCSQYDHKGQYLDYSSGAYRESARVKFDQAGIPKLKFGEQFFYHPVAIAQYALKKWGGIINEKNTGYEKEFLDGANKLVAIQKENGALPYNFEWRYYLSGETYKPGWVSAMAQGQALSVFSRAYYMTRDPKWLKAGKKTFRFLITPKEKGGVMSDLSDLDHSLEDYVVFEEYLSTPDNYTLNGYMFTLLGIYDWLKLCQEINHPSAIPEYYWKQGLRTLRNILPLYDIGGISSYDLGHYTFGKEFPHVAARYHKVHIVLLRTLTAITGDAEFERIERKWTGYVE